MSSIYDVFRRFVTTAYRLMQLASIITTYYCIIICLWCTSYEDASAHDLLHQKSSTCQNVSSTSACPFRFPCRFPFPSPHLPHLHRLSTTFLLSISSKETRIKVHSIMIVFDNVFYVLADDSSYAAPSTLGYCGGIAT